MLITSDSRIVLNQMMRPTIDNNDNEAARLMASLADNVADQDILVASRLSSLVSQLTESEFQRGKKINSEIGSFLSHVRLNICN